MVQEKRSRISGLTVVLFILLFLFLISIGEVFSQSVTRNDVPPIKERLFYGGSFGLQFRTVTDIDISPVVGIWLLPRLNIAAGPKYRYYKDRYSAVSYTHLRAHETVLDLVCRLLLEKKKQNKVNNINKQPVNNPP